MKVRLGIGSGRRFTTQLSLSLTKFSSIPGKSHLVHVKLENGALEAAAKPKAGREENNKSTKLTGEQQGREGKKL